MGAGARGAAVADRGARRRAGHGRPRRGRAAAAHRGRRLRRLLLVAPPRGERRPHLPARRRPAAAQLAPHADRLPRACGHGGGQRDADPPPERAAPRARRRRRRSSARARASTSSSSWASSSACRARWASRWPIDDALDHVFGVLLVNDWSARDIQAWEYRPLGPFLAKSFATSVGRLGHAARRGARPPRSRRRAQEPAPLAYLREDPWALDLDLEIELNGTVIARTNARHLYWSAAQQLAHLTVNGASLRVGDLFASGTISGPEREQRGCLLELSWNGAEPLELADGSTRSFLEDGDEVVLRGAGGRRARPRRGARADRAGASDGAAQGHPPAGARPPARRRAAALGLRRRGADPAAHDALRRTTRPSCARPATGRRRVVELGVYEGSSAVVLCEVLDAGAELHLVDPFGHHGWALPAGWGATEGASRRVVARAARRHAGPRVQLARRLQRRRRPALGRRRSTSSSSTATTARRACAPTGRAGTASSSPAAPCSSTTRACRSRAGAGCRGRRRWSTRSSAGLRRGRLERGAGGGPHGRGRPLVVRGGPSRGTEGRESASIPR